MRVDQSQMIVQAARRLVTKKGSGFTTQELIKEAQVALQTFYRHFTTKDELILAVIEDMVGQTAQTARAAATDIASPLDRLRFYIASVLDGPANDEDRQSAQFLAIEHWRLLARYPDEMARVSLSYADLLCEAITEAMKAGLIGAQDAKTTAYLVTHLVRSVFMHRAFMTAEEPGDQVAEAVWAFCVAGLRGPRPAD